MASDTSTGTTTGASALPKFTTKVTAQTTATTAATFTSTSSYPTPSMTVPPASNNPYIHKSSQPDGTVFIAVGTIVGVIFFSFFMYWVFISIISAKLAKKNLIRSEKQYFDNTTAYQGYHGHSNSNLYEYQPSITKLPLLKNINNQGDNQSTIYNSSEVGAGPLPPTSKNDITKMFISPTAEVMSHKKKISISNNNSTLLNSSNASFINNASQSNLPHFGVGPIGGGSIRNSTVPNLYINDEITSEYSLPYSATQGRKYSVPNNARKTVPSMYLESLIDNDSKEDLHH